MVTAAEWPQFLEEQAKLLTSRDEQAIKGQPALIATIRLPTGQTVDHFAGNWQLDTKERSENSSGEGQQSGPALSPSVLRWYHLSDGEITYLLTLVDQGCALEARDRPHSQRQDRARLNHLRDGPA